MRSARWLVLPCALLLATAVACSAKAPQVDDGSGGDDGSNPAGGGTSTTPGKTKPSSKDNTCLGTAGLTFDNAACTTCMNADDCCHKTIACFTNNPDCASLQTCMAACP